VTTILRIYCFCPFSGRDNNSIVFGATFAVRIPFCFIRNGFWLPWLRPFYSSAGIQLFYLQSFNYFSQFYFDSSFYYYFLFYRICNYFFFCVCSFPCALERSWQTKSRLKKCFSCVCSRPCASVRSWPIKSSEIFCTVSGRTNMNLTLSS
jgi:hypothetical protein